MEKKMRKRKKKKNKRFFWSKSVVSVRIYLASYVSKLKHVYINNRIGM